jgi:CubicO group peptidase (beta-lactamase class C family)
MDSNAIDQLLQAAVDEGHVPNIVAVIGDRDGVRYAGSAGSRIAGDASSGPVGPDTTYRIASMTKPIVTIAALQQMERGLLDIEAPVAKYLPEFGDLQVLTGFAGDTPQFRAPAKPATVRNLIAHTAGTEYSFFSPNQTKWEQATGTPGVIAGLHAVFASPLHFDPGTKWSYGINTDWLGEVVEATSAESLDKYLEANVTGPLGMSSATFVMSPEQRAGSVPIHVPHEGAWVPTDIDLNQSPDWWAGGHGLHCTPNDYLRFQRMLLNDGTLDGATILKPDTVAQAFSDQIAPLTFPESLPSADPTLACDFNLGPGWSWGHGFLLNSVDLPGMRAANTGAWAGLFNTHFWIDRTSGVAGSLYTQALPFGTPDILQLCFSVEMAAYAGNPR